MLEKNRLSEATDDGSVPRPENHAQNASRPNRCSAQLSQRHCGHVWFHRINCEWYKRHNIHFIDDFVFDISTPIRPPGKHFRRKQLGLMRGENRVPFRSRSGRRHVVLSFSSGFGRPNRLHSRFQWDPLIGRCLSRWRNLRQRNISRTKHFNFASEKSGIVK